MMSKLIRSAVFGTVFALGAMIMPPVGARAQDAVVLHSAGMEKLMPSSKDRALREALHLLGHRIEELPGEFDQPQIPGGPLRMLYEVLRSPMSLSVSVDPNADPEQGPPFGVQMIVESASEDEASRRAETALQFIEMAMGPGGFIDVPGMPGMKMIDMDGVRGLIGSTNVAGRPSFVMLVNRDAPAPVALGSMGLPAGVESVAGFVFDAEPLQPLMEMMIQQAGPNADQLRTQLQLQGMLGERPIRLSAATGFGGGFAHGVLNYGNFLANPMNRLMVTERRLSAIDLAMIPADATYAQVSHSKLAQAPQMLAEMLRPLAEEENVNFPTYEEMVAEFEKQVGINPETQFFAHLGTRVGMYMSDTTGGGGLASTIAFVELTDAEGMAETLGQIAEMISGMGEGMARGYVRLEPAAVEGLSNTWVLRFPGLPIPLELTLAVERGHLWFGVTPQAVNAAIAHARNPGDGLMANARFRDVAGGVPRDAVGMTFTDTPKLAARGYGLASMGMSALSNFVRSPAQKDRAKGLVMPGLRELLDGAKGSLMVTRINANDMTITTKSDPSATLNLCAAAGAVGSSPIALGVIALGAGVAMPAMETARESARHVKASTQLRQLHQAVILYHQANDKLPPDFETLMREDYFTESILVSPLGSAGDDLPDLWINLNDPRLAEFDATRIIGYDRGAYVHTDTLAVLFADGHVEQIPVWDFETMITDEKYEGIDFHVPELW